MSGQQETRFICDRCKHDESVVHNDQPALDRGKPPSGWAIITIGQPPNAGPPMHLCKTCSITFANFMEDRIG